MPNVRILIPTPLRQYAGNQNAVQVEAESVREALDDLVERHDQLRRHLFAEDGRLRNFVNVYVNEEDIRYLAQDGTSLKAGDTISIVPSIAGGSFSLMDRLAAKRKDVLSPAEIKRYSRHLILPEVGMAGTDNFPTRYLVNDASVLLKKPNVYGSIFRFEGQASVFDARKGPCYRCLYAEPPPPGLVPSCAEGGVLGVLPGIVGSIQAIEALKVLLGKEDTLIGRLLVFDALRMKFRELRLRKNPACPICGTNPTIKELIDYEEFCGLRGPSEQVGEELQISVEALKEKIDRGQPVVLVDVREPMEWEIAHLDRAVLIPVAQVPGRVNELSTADEIVVYCKTGVRSGRITNFLRDLGFRKVKNLVGGIDEWAEKVEPEMPRY